jgi:hypothetical protein
MARSSPMSPRGSTSGSRRTMIRKTDSVQGPMPLIPSNASSHDRPSRTFARISSDLCRTVTQHCARRAGRPIARRLSNWGSTAGDGLVRCGYADVTLSARRHAIRVESCCAITMRRSPQIGSSVGVEGQRTASSAINLPSAGSRLDKYCSGCGCSSAISLPLLRPFLLFRLCLGRVSFDRGSYLDASGRARS